MKLSCQNQNFIIFIYVFQVFIPVNLKASSREFEGGNGQKMSYGENECHLQGGCGLPSSKLI